jgi:hypothetical protein
MKFRMLVLACALLLGQAGCDGKQFLQPVPPNGIRVGVADERGAGVAGVLILVRENDREVGSGMTGDQSIGYLPTTAYLPPGTYDIAFTPPEGYAAAAGQWNPVRVEVRKDEFTDVIIRLVRLGD